MDRYRKKERKLKKKETEKKQTDDKETEKECDYVRKRENLD